MHHQRYRILPQGEDRVDLGAGKRKLPSPEGAVRQAALPQPLTGRERSGEEEEVVEQQLSRGRGERAVQSSESYIPQERQEQRGYLSEEGHNTENQKSRDIAGGKNNRQGTLLPFSFCFILFTVFIILKI